MKRIPATTKNIKGWDDIPIVKLGEILKPMIWFDGDYVLDDYVLFDGDTVLNICKSDYELNQQNEWMRPKSASLNIQYRKQQIIIKCKWEDEKQRYEYSEHKYPERFAIGIGIPRHPNFQHQRYRVTDKIKYAYTRFYSVAIDKIEDLIYEAQEVIDAEIAIEKSEQKKDIELESIAKRLCENLDVKIKLEKFRKREFRYRENSDYHLHFISSDDELFAIHRIGGKYTENEIKKIIEIVGGNPRAIAERLSR